MIEDWLPENYFCKFSEVIDENIKWQVYFYRYYSVLNSETIELVLDPINPNHKKVMFDDDTLREKSFINEGNLTSSAYVNVDNKKYKGVTIYARNNFIVNKKTFKIVLKEESKKSITVRIIYTLVSSLFSMLMCCICVAACCRCTGKTPSSRQTNYEVDIIDPNWDAD